MKPLIGENPEVDKVNVAVAVQIGGHIKTNWAFGRLKWKVSVATLKRVWYYATDWRYSWSLKRV